MLTNKEIYVLKTIPRLKDSRTIDLGGIIYATDYYPMVTSLANRGFIGFTTTELTIKGLWVIFRNNK